MHEQIKKLNLQRRVKSSVSFYVFVYVNTTRLNAVSLLNMTTYSTPDVYNIRYRQCVAHRELKMCLDEDRKTLKLILSR